MKNKVYVILTWYYGEVVPYSSIHGIYANEDTAYKTAKKLNAENNNPVHSDGYGPVYGKEFLVEEMEIQGD